MQGLHPIESEQVYKDLDRQIQIIRIAVLNNDGTFNDLLTIGQIKEVLEPRLNIIELYMEKYVKFITNKNLEVICSHKKQLLDILDDYNPKRFIYQINNNEDLINKINNIFSDIIKYINLFK